MVKSSLKRPRPVSSRSSSLRRKGWPISPRLFRSGSSITFASFMVGLGLIADAAAAQCNSPVPCLTLAAEETEMSAQNNSKGRVRRRGIGTIVKRAAPIVGLTAYTAPIARLLDPHVDFLLVGDSLGMVVYGFDSTVPVTLDMMIAHGAAVMRSSAQALIVVDLPFGAYQESPQQAFRSAARIMAETGCAAVKLEGGEEMVETVRFLTRRGVPVMGHVGLMPQSVNTAGGFKV